MTQDPVLTPEEQAAVRTLERIMHAYGTVIVTEFYKELFNQHRDNWAQVAAGLANAPSVIHILIDAFAWYRSEKGTSYWQNLVNHNIWRG